MATPSNDTTIHPFVAFNFAVEIAVPDVAPRVCNAAFAECDGLEMTGGSTSWPMTYLVNGLMKSSNTIPG